MLFPLITGPVPKIPVVLTMVFALEARLAALLVGHFDWLTNSSITMSIFQVELHRGVSASQNNDVAASTLPSGRK